MCASQNKNNQNICVLMASFNTRSVVHNFSCVAVTMIFVNAIEKKIKKERVGIKRDSG